MRCVRRNHTEEGSPSYTEAAPGCSFCGEPRRHVLAGHHAHIEPLRDLPLATRDLSHLICTPSTQVSSHLLRGRPARRRLQVPSRPTAIFRSGHIPARKRTTVVLDTHPRQKKHQQPRVRRRQLSQIVWRVCAASHCPRLPRAFRDDHCESKAEPYADTSAHRHCTKPCPPPLLPIVLSTTIA